jgi:asparagine synthase (glutamine-hydrolysing)
MQGYVLMESEIGHCAPTADNDLIDLILTIPPELRRGHDIYRQFLKKAFPRLAAIPYDGTGVRPDFPLAIWRLGALSRYYVETAKLRISALSKEAVSFPARKSYVDFNGWFQKDLAWRNYFGDLLTGTDAVAVRNYFNRDYVLGLCEEQFSGKKDNSMKLLYLATFELMLRIYG